MQPPVGATLSELIAGVPSGSTWIESPPICPHSSMGSGLLPSAMKFSKALKVEPTLPPTAAPPSPPFSASPSRGDTGKAPNVRSWYSMAVSEHSLPLISVSYRGGRSRSEMVLPVSLERGDTGFPTVTAPALNWGKLPPCLLSSASSFSAASSPGPFPSSLLEREILVAVISENAAWMELASSRQIGPNFHKSPQVCSKSARSSGHAVHVFFAEPELPSGFSQHRSTAFTGRKRVRVVARSEAMASLSWFNCSLKSGAPLAPTLSMQRTYTITEFSASCCVEHDGGASWKVRGLMVSFATCLLAACDLVADNCTSHKQR
mmetsp:Transcript_53623/g.155870  ORF Transcript_53623/g.155870 Transcript_53623/m.155870 type:complete len:319 (+) Transcript_53623:152-1108(+)